MMNEKWKILREVPMENIALRIKAHRYQRGISQEELAERLGVGRNTLMRWENYQVRISNIMLKMLVDEEVL